SDEDDFSELKKISALMAKAFNKKKFYSKPTNNNLRTSSASNSSSKKQEFVKSDDKKEDKKMKSCSDLDQEINVNMVFMAQIEKVFLDSEASSSSFDDKMAEQTSSLKPYVPNVILEKIIIDLEDEVVSLLDKEKENLKTIESLKTKGFELSEKAIFESENKSENDCQVVENVCELLENLNVIAPGMFKLSVSQSDSPFSVSKTSCAANKVETKTKRKRRNMNSSKQTGKQVKNDLRANRDFVHFLDLETLSSVRIPKPSGVMWRKNGDIIAKDLLSCNNSHLVDTKSEYDCNAAMHADCDSYDVDVNDLFVFDDVNIRKSQVRKMPFRKKPRCSKHKTCNQALLTNFMEKFLGTIRFGNNDFVVIVGYGDVVIGSMTINRVYYVEGLDEASEVIISFIMKTQVNLQLQVQSVRTDNGTEFKNKTLSTFFDEVIISQQFFAARTSQQNGVVERRNRTLVEAARTMLTIAKLPLFLWAKAILISNDMIPNVDEASSSYNVFNDQSEDAYFDASTSFHDSSNDHEFYQPYPHETKWTKDHPIHKIISDPNIEPANVAKALKDVDWVIAMQDELDQFARLKVQRLVPKPDGKTIIKTKLSFKNMKDKSIARIEAIRLFLAYATHTDFTVFQMDVETAFLKGILKEEVYVSQPLSFVSKQYPDHMYALEKSLNGLKQAPQTWEKEAKNIDKEITLGKKVKELDNIVYKMGQSMQTVYMLTKLQVFYDNNLKQALGFQNPFYIKKAQQIRPMLYDGCIIAKETNVILISNLEETLIVIPTLNDIGLRSKN
nr:retrovirus-related Pol polyprotein from transposon TNT 1-94 [Tanacetum cinerariifolium]